MSQVQTMISITLPDGSSRNVETGSTCADLAKSISQGLGKKAVGATINGELRDLHTPLKDGDSVKILTAQDPESIEYLRHSTAHVMAEAVQKIFPQAKIAIGPTIQDGFYYDFDIPDHTLTPDDLQLIEAEMKKIAEANQRIERFAIPDVDKQLNEFKSQGEKFKAELLEQHRNDEPTLYLMKDKDGESGLERPLPRTALTEHWFD